MNRLNRITRSLAAIGTGIALAFGGIVGTTPAVANTRSPNFVTKAEFQRVDKGMKMERVRRIFDVKGQQIRRLQRPAQQTRRYPVRSTHGRYYGVKVGYKNNSGTWTVTWKDAYWDYVTKAEFNQVRPGMTMRRVHRIFDTTGRVVPARKGEQLREYAVKSTPRTAIDSSDYAGAWIRYAKDTNGTWRVIDSVASWVMIRHRAT